MSAIQDVNVSIAAGEVTLNRLGFGVPLLVGFTGQRAVAIMGTGNASFAAKSTIRNAGGVTLTILVTGAVYIYADSGSDVTITVPTTSSVNALLADFIANATAPVTDLLTLAIETGSTGKDDVVAQTVQNLLFTEFREILDVSQLVHFYDSADVEQTMFANMLSEAPRVKKVILLDVKNEPDISVCLIANDDNSWFAIVTTSVQEVDQQVISDFVEQRTRVAIFTTDDATRVDTINNKRTFYLVHDTNKLDDHPEASWVARELSFVPGSNSWKFSKNLSGQTATTASLSVLLTTRGKRAQSYVSANGFDYVDGGLTSDQVTKTFIDQIISRDWVTVNLENDILEFLVNQATTVGKVPYTDAGIQQVIDVIAARLSLAGANNIIDTVSNQTQASDSYDGIFRYSITSKTRAQIETDSPADITNRELNTISFQYIEAGAIDEITVKGLVVLGA